MKSLIFVCLSLLMFTACSPATQASLAPAATAVLTPAPTGTSLADGTAGIAGQVVLGPTCPVVQKDTPCLDKPYQATLTVLTTDRRPVTRFTTGADGKFRISLAPGEYILHPESPNGAAYPRGREQSFTVAAAQFTPLTVSYDSGMR
jgi:hypothetical protein